MKRFAKTLAEARDKKGGATSWTSLAASTARRARISFADYAASWIATYDGRTARGYTAGHNPLLPARPRTRRGRQPDWRRAPSPTSAGCRSLTITAQDVKRVRGRVREGGSGSGTRSRLRIAPVKALPATAHEEGLIRANPAAGLRLGLTVATAPVKETRALNEEEVVRRARRGTERHRLLVELLAQTGLRISEALALHQGGHRLRETSAASRAAPRGPANWSARRRRYGVRQVPLSPGMARQLWTRLAMAEDDALVFATSTGRAARPFEAVRGCPCGRESERGSTGRWGCTLSGNRALRSCSGAASRRKKFGGCSAITPGTSPPGRICISTMTTCRMCAVVGPDRGLRPER